MIINLFHCCAQLLTRFHICCFSLSGSSLPLDFITDLHLLYSLPAHRSFHRSAFLVYSSLSIYHITNLHFSTSSLPTDPITDLHFSTPSLYLFPIFYFHFSTSSLSTDLITDLHFHTLTCPHFLSQSCISLFPPCSQILSQICIFSTSLPTGSYHRFTFLSTSLYIVRITNLHVYLSFFGVFLSYLSLSSLFLALEQSVILAHSSMDFYCLLPLWPFCSLSLMENSPSLPIRLPDAPSNNLFNINSAFHDHCLPILLSTNSPSMILCDAPPPPHSIPTP